MKLLVNLHPSAGCCDQSRHDLRLFLYIHLIISLEAVNAGLDLKLLKIFPAFYFFPLCSSDASPNSKKNMSNTVHDVILIYAGLLKPRPPQDLTDRENAKQDVLFSELEHEDEKAKRSRSSGKQVPYY